LLIDSTPLIKVFQLECEKGYTDSVVFGGLDKFITRWAAKVEGAITNRQLLSRFHQLHLDRPGYALLNREQRQRWLDDVIDFVSEAEKAADKIDKATPPPMPGKSSPKPIKRAAPAYQSLNSPITTIKGVSSSLATSFGKLGVTTIRDLLYFFPNRHLDYSQRKTISRLEEGNEETIIANIWQVRQVILGSRRSTEAIVGDETGNVRVVWFNNPYLVKRLATNNQVVISGRLSIFKGRPVFQSPEWEILEDRELVHTGRLVPVYPLTRGLKPRQVRKLIKEVVDCWAPQIEDFLPPEVAERRNLIKLPQAITQAHFPENEAAKSRARVRLAFDELFLLQLGVLGQKRQWQEGQPGSPFEIDRSLLQTWINTLPFSLTSAQDRVIDEIIADLSKTKPMSRLLQGEVGSGKTVVALAALLMAAANGYQGAFMAPTEILAEQHFNNVCQILSQASNREEREDYQCRYYGLLEHPITAAMLIGDIKGSRKQELQQQIKTGDINIIIGTHALIQKEVSFHRLGIAVIDEQHRFGVAQRQALRQKGFSPHILIMTATPIPRTLALTLYGDLDLSTIDELPPGRQEIKTRWLKPTQRESAYNFLQRQVDIKRQAYIICPLIEESEAVQARAAIAEYENLSQQVFPRLKLGLLHGRMSAAEKDEVMGRFRSTKLDILVSTPVIEVGIDIPNATVMLVESADRFGLSQLHQFRGRVGRGKEQSYCLLLAENPSQIGKERLDIIERIQNGFELADEDLKMRGPGEFFGTRQSGLPDLRMAKISDIALLEMARGEAERLFAQDTELKNPKHQLLVKELSRVWPQEGSEWS
jgi:ATP-dependent DNA helicase RecG